MRHVIIINIIIHLVRFSHQLCLMVFQWSLRNKVSSGLQDSSQYSGRSQQCCSMNGLDSFSDFQLFQPSFSSLFKWASDNWYYRNLQVPQLSLLSRKTKHFFIFFVYLFCILIRKERKSSTFLLIITSSGLVGLMSRVFTIGFQGMRFWTEGRDPVVAQTKGRGPLVSQTKGETRWLLKQICQHFVCVLWPLHYFTKTVPATEERYVRNISDCIPTTHNRHRRKIKI